MNIAAVTTTTKSESPKIESAGVEAGAKILVGLSGLAGYAKAPDTEQIIRTKTIRSLPNALPTMTTCDHPLTGVPLVQNSGYRHCPFDLRWTAADNLITVPA